MGFGFYDDASPVSTNSTADVVVRCARNGGPASVDVTLRLGPSAGSGTIATRQLRSGANALNYNLYRDAARTQVWGQTAGADTVTMNINGIPNNGSRNGTFTIYGRIPALENAPAGAYTDSVQMTISP
jgi:spore coat protein U-like protein